MYEFTFILILCAVAVFACCWAIVIEIFATFRPLRGRAFDLKSMFFASTAFCLVLVLLKSEIFSYHLRGIVIFLIPVWVVLGVVFQIFLEDFRKQTAGLSSAWEWRRISLDRPTMLYTTLGGFVGWMMVAELSWPLSLVAALVLVPLFLGMGIVGKYFLEDSSDLNQRTSQLNSSNQPVFSPEMRIPPKRLAKPKTRLRFRKPARSRGSPVDSAVARYSINP